MDCVPGALLSASHMINSWYIIIVLQGRKVRTLKFPSETGRQVLSTWRWWEAWLRSPEVMPIYKGLHWKPQLKYQVWPLPLLLVVRTAQNTALTEFPYQFLHLLLMPTYFLHPTALSTTHPPSSKQRFTELRAIQSYIVYQKTKNSFKGTPYFLLIMKESLNKEGNKFKPRPYLIITWLWKINIPVTVVPSTIPTLDVLWGLSTGKGLWYCA